MAKGCSDGKANSTTNDTKAAGDKGDKPEPPTQYQFAQKPEEKPGWEGFKQFLWNSETKQFLGRTGCSWLKITVYYIIYYTFLALYFMAMLYIFYQTLDDKVPKWQGTNGIIGGNPGLGFRPLPPDSYIESTMIKYVHGSYAEQYKPWVERLDNYLKNYASAQSLTLNISSLTQDYTDLLENPKPKPNVADCDFGRPAGPSQVCKANVTELFKSPCNPDNQYGFMNGDPCILLKLNKIYGWVPDPYENATALPSDVPKHLRDYVESKTSDKMMGKMVWLSCEGENPADIENLGDIEYFPYPGFPVHYFPYENQEEYLAPVVFAHLKKPKKGVLISVWCKGWAHNIVHDKMERRGSVHFELLID